MGSRDDAARDGGSTPRRRLTASHHSLLDIVLRVHSGTLAQASDVLGSPCRLATLTRLRGSALALVIAALALATAAAATDALPTQCGVVGRPNVQAVAVLGLIGGGLLLFAGTFAAVAVKGSNRSRLALLGVALLELGGWIAALLFYLHQTGGSYPNCG